MTLSAPRGLLALGIASITGNMPFLSWRLIGEGHARKHRVLLFVAVILGGCSLSQSAKSDEPNQKRAIVEVNGFTLSIPNNIQYIYYPNTETHTQNIQLLVPFDILKFEPYRPWGERSGNLFAIILRPETEAGGRLSNSDRRIVGKTPEVQGEWDVYKGQPGFDLYVNNSGHQPHFFSCQPEARSLNWPGLCEARQIFNEDHRNANGKDSPTTLIYGFTPHDIPRLTEMNQRVLDFLNGLLIHQ